jgi:hypothetical protein
MTMSEIMTRSGTFILSGKWPAIKAALEAMKAVEERRAKVEMN